MVAADAGCGRFPDDWGKAIEEPGKR